MGSNGDSASRLARASSPSPAPSAPSVTATSVGCAPAPSASGCGLARAAISSTWRRSTGSLQGRLACWSRLATARSARRPWVMVPVLSAQATSTRPRASMAARRRTSACRPASRRATAASPTLASSGKPSGTAASARLAPIASCDASAPLRSSPEVVTIAPPMAASGSVWRSRRLSRAPSGLSLVSSSASAAAVAPMRVYRPTATTTARPVPEVTSLPSSRMRLAAVPPVGALGTGSDSPVSAASSTSSPLALTTRASAATRSPVASSSISPGTTSLAGMLTLLPGADQDICPDGGGNDAHISNCSHDEREAGASSQDAGERGAQLIQKRGTQRLALCLWRGCLSALQSLGGGQTLFRGVQGTQHIGNGALPPALRVWVADARQRRARALAAAQPLPAYRQRAQRRAVDRCGSGFQAAFAAQPPEDAYGVSDQREANGIAYRQVVPGTRLNDGRNRPKVGGEQIDTRREMAPPVSEANRQIAGREGFRRVFAIRDIADQRALGLPRANCLDNIGVGDQRHPGAARHCLRGQWVASGDQPKLNSPLLARSHQFCDALGQTWPQRKERQRLFFALAAQQQHVVAPVAQARTGWKRLPILEWFQGAACALSGGAGNGAVKGSVRHGGAACRREGAAPGRACRDGNTSR